MEGTARVPSPSGLRLNAMTPGDLEGSVIGPVAHRVDRDRIDAFVQATGDDPGRWIAHAPPGYASVLLFSVAGVLLNDARIGPYLSTLIHVDQQFAYFGAFDIDSEIQVTGIVERVRERAGAFFVTFTASGTAHDEVMFESHSTFLMSDQAAADSVIDRSEPAVGQRGPNEVAPAMQPVEIGQVSSMAKSASRSDLVRYSSATRDFNPLHWDHASARSAGLDGVVVHGLLMLSWMVQQASAFAAGSAPVASIKVRFRSALGPAVPALVESTATEISPDGSEAKLLLKVKADGADVVTGNAVVHLAQVTP